MLIEIGHFALILALIFALLQFLIPTIGIISSNKNLSQAAKILSWGQLFWVTVSFVILLNAFIADDFTVKYVADNSNTELPIIFKISALWGAHEGSLLLWILILAIWSVAVSIFSKRMPITMLNHILAVLGFISVGFLLFILLTSNPFEVLAIAPIQGSELNPLLQDIGLAIHPPMLYIGYVGMSVPFAFVICALIRGKLDSNWLRWSRPWTLIAWAFLTIGITLGSWWAYYELGWGGWWFWDPVENASFMPWLAATALVHSLSVSEKRATFKHWTVLLAITSFSLSLLGAFLVRSGILTSVHSFASDPTRGVFILAFLIIIVGGSLALYAWRANLMQSDNNLSLLSKEGALLTNNIVFMVALFSVFLGTLYPLLLDALGLGKISVGAPYFSAVFVPIMVLGIIFMAFAPFLRWKQDNITRHKKMILVWVSLILLFVVCFVITANIYVALAIFLFAWVLTHSLILLVQRYLRGGNINTSFIAMIIAHIGIGVFALGATITTQYGIEKDLKMAPNDIFTMGDYKFIFNGVEKFSNLNYSGYKAEVEVYHNKEKISILYPEKRQYVSGLPMTEAAIDPSLYRDIYISLGEDLGDGAWSIRIYYKPLIRLIWLGALLIAFGAILAACDKRYRIRYKS